MIYINEAFPNPVGKDVGNEWLELWNDGQRPISLEGWQLAVNGKAFALHGMIDAGSYRLLRGKELRRALTNREAMVGLYDAGGRLHDGIKLYGTAHEGRSYSRFPDSAFRWTVPTPGETNSTTHAVPLAASDFPYGANLAVHTSFTHVLGSGILIAFILSVFITSIFLKSHALPNFFRHPHAHARR